MRYFGRIVILVSALAAVACLAGSAAAAELWTDNFAQAQAQAKKEGKDLLVDFTSSDWCPWCVKLRLEVFGKEKFKTEAPKKYVLVELDFPRTKTLSDEVKKQNTELQQKYQISGFPTVLLMDADGKVYAKTGYQAGGEEPFLKHLDEMKAAAAEHDKALAESEKATGLDRAKLLDKILETAAIIGMPSPEDRGRVEEIVKLDSKNEAGLKAKYEQLLRMQDLVKLARQGKLEEAVKAADQAVADLKLTGEDAQKILFIKAQCVFAKGAKAGAPDKESTLAVLKEALDAAPKSKMADDIREVIKEFSQPKPPAPPAAEESPKAPPAEESPKAP
jgi:thioredoxin-related protein